jgi:hypothetical protein
MTPRWRRSSIISTTSRNSARPRQTVSTCLHCLSLTTKTATGRLSRRTRSKRSAGGWKRLVTARRTLGVLLARVSARQTFSHASAVSQWEWHGSSIASGGFLPKPCSVPNHGRAGDDRASQPNSATAVPRLAPRPAVEYRWARGSMSCSQHTQVVSALETRKDLKA